MPTDEERRFIAQELRACKGGWSSGECYYTIVNALGLPDTSRDDGGHALYAAIADLIEPEPVPIVGDDGTTIVNVYETKGDELLAVEVCDLVAFGAAQQLDVFDDERHDDEIEARVIIRCRDCAKAMVGDRPSRIWCSKFGAFAPLDGFCAWGKRKGTK